MSEEKKKVKRIPAIREYLQRQDDISPEGGKKLEMPELKSLKLGLKEEDIVLTHWSDKQIKKLTSKLSDEDLNELGQLCCDELGHEFIPG